jgi:predicted SprT family Zn-dependent metalloprotease
VSIFKLEGVSLSFKETSGEVNVIFPYFFKYRDVFRIKTHYGYYCKSCYGYFFKYRDVLRIKTHYGYYCNSL